MVADQTLDRLAAHQVRDEGAHVAALGDVAGVAEAVHQLRPRACGAAGVPAELGRLGREAVAGQGRQHEVEGVLGVATVRRRVGQRADRLEQLDDRAGPAVRHDQRQRVLVLGLDVDEVDVHPVDLGRELRQRVEPCLGLAPVVVGRPVARQLLDRRQLHALRPIGDELLARQPGGGEALAGGRRGRPAAPRPGRGGCRRWRCPARCSVGWWLWSSWTPLRSGLAPSRSMPRSGGKHRHGRAPQKAAARPGERVQHRRHRSPPIGIDPDRCRGLGVSITGVGRRTGSAGAVGLTMAPAFSGAHAAGQSLERLRGDLVERIKPDARRPIYQTKVWVDTFVSVRQGQIPVGAVHLPPCARRWAIRYQGLMDDCAWGEHAAT